MRFIRSCFSILMCLVILLAGTVHADSTADPTNPSDYDEAALNGDWTNYVPNEADSSDTCASGSVSLTGDGNIQQIYNYLIGKGLTNIQAISIMANIQGESGFETRLVEYSFPNSRGEISHVGQASSLDDDVPVKSNDKGQPGYGLAQWSGGRKVNLANFASTRNVKGSDLAMQLDFLWSELTTSYNVRVLTPLKSITALNDGVELVLRHFEVPAEIGKHLPERIGFANSLYKKLGAAPAVAAAVTPTVPVFTTATSGTITTGSTGCDIVANGNIVQTALSLAWPTNGHGKFKSDAKPNYQIAMPKYNGSTGEDEFSDCGVFVSTVMIASGADTNYPKRGTGVQMDYLATSPKYVEVKSTNTGDLQPGDIFITDGHTYMYVGTQTGGYNSVGGSLHDHVPQAAGQAHFSDNYGAGGSTRVYKVYRLKG